jgi:hypothetical protein
MAKTKQPRLDDAARERIAEFFPDALRKALDSYQEFVAGAESLAAEDFKDHHTAAKVAIAHIELLLKLGQWARLAGDGEEEAELYAALLGEAETEVSAYREEILS